MEIKNAGESRHRKPFTSIPTPPQLVKAVLNGQPIHMLYMTRQGDKVLARCYPGFEPTIAVRTMSGGTKEGMLTCKTAQ